MGCGGTKSLKSSRQGSFPPGDHLLIGNYQILQELGRGMGGGAVYCARPLLSPERAMSAKDPLVTVAVKFPLNYEELCFFSALQTSHLLGVPEIFELASCREQSYVAMEVLGSPISEVFSKLAACDLELRWRFLRILGRQLLRRLRALHGFGFVHCDIKPSNILLDAASEQPYLVDFGCARQFPGGSPMQNYWGSVDFSSIKSLSGQCCREPLDDLESLGWMLLHGLFGELPWFPWTNAAWSRDDPGGILRANACEQSRLAKVAFIEIGGNAFDPKWEFLNTIPEELLAYLCLCYKDQSFASNTLPDYDEYSALFGDTGVLSTDEAEEQDLFASKGVQKLVEEAFLARARQVSI